MRVKALLFITLALLAAQALAGSATKHTKPSTPTNNTTTASDADPDGLTVISDQSFAATAPAYSKPVSATAPSSAATKATPAIASAAPVTGTVVTIDGPVSSGAANSPLPVWRAPDGSTLRAVLADWSARAGYRPPVWDSPALDTCDFPIDGDLTFKGSFEEAVSKLLPPYGSAKQCALAGHVYTKQRLVRIEVK